MVFDILNYMKSCPYLSDCNMNIDYLGKSVRSLSVSGRSNDETVRVYTDGDSLTRSEFILKLRLPYGVDKSKNRANSILLKNIEEWFLQNSSKGILPELGEEKIPVSVSADFSRDNVTYLADTAVFTANVAVLYYKTKSH